MAHAASPLGPCAPFNQSLARLQAETGSGHISGSMGLLDGTLKLHADPALQVGGAWRSPAGRLLELDLETAGPGKWIGLHLALGQLDLMSFRYAGMACRSAADGIEVLRPCLRAGLPDGRYSDCFFPRHLLARLTPPTTWIRCICLVARICRWMPKGLNWCYFCPPTAAAWSCTTCGCSSYEPDGSHPRPR